jgi:Uma2 family endonuclease
VGGEVVPAHYDLAPDWVCEVLSPSTTSIDRHEKMPVYAREKVPHLWIVDPRKQQLEVFALAGSEWTLRATHRGAAKVRAEPFDAIELDLADVWSS